MFRTSSDFNILLATDSYKATHWKQYPPKTEHVYSYFESRGGEFDYTVFFGLQYFLKRYLEGIVVTKQYISEAEEIISQHVGHFNREGWDYIRKEHEGRLPVRIKAVPEGTKVPTGNVLMTIENTDPNCYWLTNYLETMLVQVWYPTTVATLSNHVRGRILRYLEANGSPEEIDFKFHDFGYRGVSSQESAGLGGAAHLVNFKGTDTMAAIMLLREYYRSECAGFSIPASEHSTITSWGQENETDAFRNMLEQYPDGLVACVSDSYNIWDACLKKWGEELKEQVLARDGTLVVRPDSGEPVEEIVYQVFSRLAMAFGSHKNAKGYDMLPPEVRIIQGDGVDTDSISRILAKLNERKVSSDNVAFGCGGALLQKLNRDTQKFAFKCSSITIDGEQCDVFKDPITDIGKRSKAGRLALERLSDGNFSTVDEKSTIDDDNALVTVFENGVVTKEWTLEKIRERALK